MRHFIWQISPLGPVLILAACVGDAKIVDVLEEVATVAVAPSTETMRPGETRQLSATVTGENGMPLQRALEWTSSDNTTATVSQSGLVTGLKVGPVTITASTGGKSGTSNFTIAQQPPTVVTLPATDVTATSAKINGTVNPNGGPTTGSFEWGTTATLGQFCDFIQVGSSTTPQELQCELGNIPSGTTIHYRVIGENEGGIAHGEILTFTTVPIPPVVVTLPATDVSATGGIANGTVNPKGSETTAFFQIGPTANLGFRCAGDRILLPVDEDLPVECTFRNFTGGTTIFYRIFATSAGGTSTGETLSFRTLGATVQTLPATEVDMTGGNIRGSVDPNGQPTIATLEFGSSAALGRTCPGTVDVPQPSVVFCRVSPNAPGITVFYRIWAQSGSAISRGAILRFTTLSSGPATASSTAASLPMIEGIADRLIEAARAIGPFDATTSMPSDAWWTSPGTPALITARMKVAEQR